MECCEAECEKNNEVGKNTEGKAPSWFFGSTWPLMSLVSIFSVFHLGLWLSSWTTLLIGMCLILVGMFKFPNLLGVLAPLLWWSMLFTHSFQTEQKIGLTNDLSNYFLVFSIDWGIQIAVSFFVSLFLIKKEI